jgi:hypothetical protein
MVKETLQMITAALKDSTYGVNAQLSGSGVPLIASIGAEVDDNEVALGNPSKPYPSLSVTLNEPLQLVGEVDTFYRDGIDMAIAVAYMGRDVAIAKGNSEMWDTMRAVQRCFRDWLRNINASDRQLDGIQVIASTGMEVLPNTSGPEDVLIPGGIIIRLRTRDIQP